MKNKILTSLVLAIYCGIFTAEGKPKIVTSITPIAGIITMLTKQEAKIVAINSFAGCPHDYQLKPSDMAKVNDAAMLVYIDDSFDIFITKLKKKSLPLVIKISEIRSLNFLDKNGDKNWHFWLNLDNVLQLQENITPLLKQILPAMQEDIEKNKNKAKEKIEHLVVLKKEALDLVDGLVLASDSLEHFFTGYDAKIIRLYKKTNHSLNDYQTIQKIIRENPTYCVVLDNGANAGLYKKFTDKIIYMDSENWVKKNGFNDIKDDYEFFYDNYLLLIEQIKSCRNIKM